MVNSRLVTVIKLKSPPGDRVRGVGWREDETGPGGWGGGRRKEGGHDRVRGVGWRVEGGRDRVRGVGWREDV